MVWKSPGGRMGLGQQQSTWHGKDKTVFLLLLYTLWGWSKSGLAVCQAGDYTSVVGCAYTLPNDSGMSTWDLGKSLHMDRHQSALIQQTTNHGNRGSYLGIVPHWCNSLALRMETALIQTTQNSDKGVHNCLNLSVRQKVAHLRHVQGYSYIHFHYKSD